jgi:hypothetical protein
MKVPYYEGIASHIGPESCVGDRKGAGEALTDKNAGRVLSRESGFASGGRRCQQSPKATQVVPISRGTDCPRVVEDPAHPWKLSAREPRGSQASPGEMASGDAP